MEMDNLSSFVLGIASIGFVFIFVLFGKLGADLSIQRQCDYAHRFMIDNKVYICNLQQEKETK